MSLHDKIAEMLRTTGLKVFVQQTPGNPPTPYLVLRDGVGVAEAHRLSIQPLWASVYVDVLAVASTPDGCRHAALLARQAIAGKRPDNNSPPLVEVDSGPVLVDGQTPADPRYSITIRYHTKVQIGAM